MLKIAICDPDGQNRVFLRTIFEEYLETRDYAGRILSFKNGEEMLRAIDEEGLFDIYLLGITQPALDGVEIGKQIRARDTEGFIFYLADTPDFALAGYETWAFQYLVRPFEAEELTSAVDRAMPMLQKGLFSGITVKTKGGAVRLLFDEILYAELTDRTVRYVCKNRTEESLSLTGSFRNAVAPLLEDERFRMCGASFAVNLYYIREVDRLGAELITGGRLHLPKSACSALRSEWIAYWRKENTGL